MSTPASADPSPPRPPKTAATVSDPDFGAKAGHASASSAASPEPPVWSLPGDTLGRYRIVRELGRGGMGVVVEAYDPTLDRRVALKVLDANARRQTSRRQRREAQALARLSHPNVVGIYEVGTLSGRDCIAMELVDGESLATWHQTPRPWSEVLDAYVQAGRGLAAVHAQGLLHRDFKPSNCLIDADGRVRVADFGLAGDQTELRRRSEEEVDPNLTEEPPSSLGDLDPFGERLTRTGAVMGTLAYMSPEQRRGIGLDARSDQFSYCASICEGLLGRSALPTTPLEYPSLLRQAKIRLPRSIHRAVSRGLAIDPRERWPSVAELVDALDRARRPRRALWAGALVLANIGLVTTMWASSREPPCLGAAQRLEGTWDPQQMEAIEHAIMGTGLPYASDTATAVRERLSRYADDWISMRTETCQAHANAELSAAGMDLRMGCLDSRRLALEQTVEQLRQADAQAVEHAVEVVAGLPSLRPCVDPERLSAAVQPPAEHAEALDALRAALGRARTRLRAGRYDDGLRLAETLLAEATELGWEPAIAEVQLLRGELRIAMGRYEDASADLRSARAIALRHDQVDLAAEAATQLTFVLGVPLSEREGATLLGESAVALALRADPGGPREAEALLSVAQVHAKHGDDAEAEQHFERALALLRATDDVDPLDVVGALDGLRGVLRRQGRLTEAEDLAREAIARVERDLGAEHPAMAYRLANLAAVLVDEERYDLAEQALRRALALTSLPSEHPARAHAHGNLGAVLLHQGRNEPAEAEFRTALSIWQQVHSPDHDRVADVRVNLGVVARRQGHLEEAEEHYRQARARYVDVYGEHHPKVAQVDRNLGSVLDHRGEPQSATESFERALAAAERYGGPEHLDVAKALEALGRLSYQQAHYRSALPLQRRALRIVEQRGGGPNRARIARAQWAVGRTELALGLGDEARLHLEKAHQTQTETSARPLDRARTELTLAQLRWDHDRMPAEARALAQRALDRLESQDDRRSEALREQLTGWLEQHR